MPIIMLTAKGDDMDKILGLEYGADDYITKPFNILEVKARIKAIMRRSSKNAVASNEPKMISFNKMKIDCDNRRVYIDETEVNLTVKEFDLLELMVLNPNKVYSRENLLNIVWGYDYPGDVRTVDVHIRRLREKIEGNPSEPKYIHTKWGVGYFSRIKNRLKYFNSMRLHMLIVFIIVGVIPLHMFTYILLNNCEEKAVGNKYTQMQNQLMMLSNQMLPTGYLTLVDVPEIDAEISRVAEIFKGRIVVVNDNLNIVEDTYGLYGDNKYLVSKEVIQSFNGNTNKIHDKEHQYLILTQPITHTTEEGKVIVGAIVMNSSTKDIQTIIDSMEQRAIIFSLALAMFVVIFAIYFSGRLTRPLTNVVNSIDRLTEGYMEEEVSIKGYYEIERISDSFNKMINGMQKIENSRQEFVSNVSHELKTPITSIKVLADSLLMQEDTPAELYREFLVDITEEIERENKIINDLLSLVKLNKTSGDLNISSININELLEQILKRLRPIAKTRNIEMVYESFRPVIAEVDEVKISLAISNLIENAIKYNTEDGWIRVSLNADHKYFFIKISDSGIGIPEDVQDLIFERFYRVDKARSRESGGTGLGLAITRSVIQMHRGAIKVYSKEGEGTTFNVRIPLNFIA